MSDQNTSGNEPAQEPTPKPEPSAWPAQAPAPATPAPTATPATPQTAAPQPVPQQTPYYGGAAAQAPAPQKKIWPWIALACVLAFLLGLGGCVGCTAVTTLVGAATHNREDTLHQFEYDDPYSYGIDPDNLPDSDLYGGFTMDDIRGAAGDVQGDVQDGNVASEGVYVVGRDLSAGRYFMQGDPSVESSYYLFTPEGSGTFSLKSAISYTGNYFGDLEDGDIVVFLPKVPDARMLPATDADFAPQAPYTGGLYRVGEDIPAGTYRLTVSDDAPKTVTQDYAAYVMADLDFNDDSILETHYLLHGISQEVTVEDGQWLELFGATATPLN